MRESASSAHQVLSNLNTKKTMKVIPTKNSSRSMGRKSLSIFCTIWLERGFISAWVSRQRCLAISRNTIRRVTTNLCIKFAGKKGWRSIIFSGWTPYHKMTHRHHQSSYSWTKNKSKKWLIESISSISKDLKNLTYIAGIENYLKV